QMGDYCAVRHLLSLERDVGSLCFDRFKSAGRGSPKATLAASNQALAGEIFARHGSRTGDATVSLFAARNGVLNEHPWSILAGNLASQLRHIAAAVAPAIHSSLRDRVRIDSPDQMKPEMEVLCFCIHLVDRAAFREFARSEERQSLVDEIG